MSAFFLPASKSQAIKNQLESWFFMNPVRTDQAACDSALT